MRCSGEGLHSLSQLLVLSSPSNCAPQYLYNLEVYGHKEYSRRDKSELAAAQNKVEDRAATGELGPLSPLE